MASAEPAAAPAQACIDHGAAQQFLSLLGKNAVKARLSAFPHRALVCVKGFILLHTP